MNYDDAVRLCHTQAHARTAGSVVPVGDFDRGDRKRSPGRVVQLSPLPDMKARGAGRDTPRHDSRLHKNQPRAISRVFTLLPRHPAAPSPPLWAFSCSALRLSLVKMWERVRGGRRGGSGLAS